MDIAKIQDLRSLINLQETAPFSVPNSPLKEGSFSNSPLSLCTLPLSAGPGQFSLFGDPLKPLSPLKNVGLTTL
jgi:hypothetical protein